MTKCLRGDAKVHDVNMLDELDYEKENYYIMDNGYVDFTRLHKLHASGAYFVTCAKKNMRFHRMHSREAYKTVGIRCDQIETLETYKSLKAYPDKLRRVKYHDDELGKVFVFITNNTELSAKEIALPYKNRLVGGTVFQMNKATTESKIFLGHYDECCQNTSVLCHHNILFDYHLLVFRVFWVPISPWDILGISIAAKTATKHLKYASVQSEQSKK